MLRLNRILLGLSLLMLPFLLGCSTIVCDAGGTQVCVCPGGADGAQTCSSDGSGWGDCDCAVADDDDDVAPDDDDVAPDDDDVAPDDDDVAPDDDDVAPDDDDVAPDDDDVAPDDDDVAPDDDDSGDDDDSAGNGFAPVACPGPDQSVCDNPSNCPYPAGCTCVLVTFAGADLCMPNCSTTPDCPVGSPLTCQGGICLP
jgi:hypothetical protein